MKIDLEREYLVNDKLAKEIEWGEQERFYEMERNKRLPAKIMVMLPNLIKNENISNKYSHSED